MELLDLDGSEQEAINILDFYIAHGLTETAALQLVLHMLLTRTYAFETDARAAAAELGIQIPFIFPGNGKMH